MLENIQPSPAGELSLELSVDGHYSAWDIRVGAWLQDVASSSPRLRSQSICGCGCQGAALYWRIAVSASATRKSRQNVKTVTGATVATGPVDFISIVNLFSDRIQSGEAGTEARG